MRPSSPAAFLSHFLSHIWRNSFSGMAHFSALKASPSLARSTLCQRLGQRAGNCPKEVTFVRRISGDPARYFSLRPSCSFILHRWLARRHLVTFFTTPIDWREGNKTYHTASTEGERKRSGPLRSLTLSSARI